MWTIILIWLMTNDKVEDPFLFVRFQILYMGVSINGVSQNGWFIISWMEHPIKMDDLEIPPFQETSICPFLWTPSEGVMVLTIARLGVQRENFEVLRSALWICSTKPCNGSSHVPLWIADVLFPDFGKMISSSLFLQMFSFLVSFHLIFHISHGRSPYLSTPCDRWCLDSAQVDCLTAGGRWLSWGGLDLWPGCLGCILWKIIITILITINNH